MRRQDSSPPRVIGFAAIVAALAAITAVTLANGFSRVWVERVVQGLSVFAFGAGLISGVIVLVILRLAGWRDSEEEFDRLVDHAEALALAHGENRDPRLLAGPDPDGHLATLAQRDFDGVLRGVLDALGVELHRALEHVDILVVASAASGARTGRARRLGPYGAVRTDADGFFSECIVLYRERLLRDFGNDHELLSLQLRNMLSQELARVLVARDRERAV